MPDRVQLRARFWPRFFRWAVVLQSFWAVFIGLGVLFRGMDQDLWIPLDMLLTWGIVSAFLAVLSLFITFRRRHLGCAELTPLGIRPYSHRLGWDFRYRWSDLETVRLKAGPFGNRWLEVVPADAPQFKLTARPTEPDQVLDALERFAGPDHPLTQAYATMIASD